MQNIVLVCATTSWSIGKPIFFRQIPAKNSRNCPLEREDNFTMRRGQPTKQTKNNTNLAHNWRAQLIELTAPQLGAFQRKTDRQSWFTIPCNHQSYLWLQYLNTLFHRYTVVIWRRCTSVTRCDMGCKIKNTKCQNDRPTFPSSWSGVSGTLAPRNHKFFFAFQTEHSPSKRPQVACQCKNR